MEDTPVYNIGDAAREMPRYVSCKRVWALRIRSIEPLGHGCRLTFQEPGYGPRVMDADWVARHRPQAGGYLVVYEDGYTSWSPAEAFERGCVPEDQWGIPRSQETKYGVNLRGKLFNRATGREVTCPAFIVLAKDRRALPTLLAYRAEVHDEDTISAVDTVVLSFSDFQRQHPEQMKDGDSRRPPPPEPHSIQRWQPGEREGT